MKPLVFWDRQHAGRLLGEALAGYAGRNDVLVLGLPRGGVPVAREVARRLQAPLDVLVVRKLGVPGWEELAMGAVASGGVLVINEETVRESGIPRRVIEAAANAQLTEVRRRELAYRGHHDAPVVAGRTVIVVDDGIATGSTIKAAIRALRAQNPKRLVVAVPTAPPDTCAEIEPMVDELVALSRPAEFVAVGQWYENFPQLTDAEVNRVLQQDSDR